MKLILQAHEARFQQMTIKKREQAPVDNYQERGSEFPEERGHAKLQQMATENRLRREARLQQMATRPKQSARSISIPAIH